MGNRDYVLQYILPNINDYKPRGYPYRVSTRYLNKRGAGQLYLHIGKGGRISYEYQNKLKGSRRFILLGTYPETDIEKVFCQVDKLVKTRLCPTNLDLVQYLEECIYEHLSEHQVNEIKKRL